jgi:hypothetical protein
MKNTVVCSCGEVLYMSDNCDCIVCNVCNNVIVNTNKNN